MTDPAVKADVTVSVNKGDRVRASWFAAKLVGLAGVQMKFGADSKTITGVIKHIRCDDPANPKEIRIYIDPDSDWDGPRVTAYGCTCPTAHVEVLPAWIEAKL